MGEDEVKKRVEQELQDLSEKIQKLSAFLYSRKALDVSGQMRQTMEDQLHSMESYARALQHRIKIWGKTDEEIFTEYQIGKVY